MGRFTINEDGLDQFFAGVQEKFDAAVARGQDRAAGEGPDATAEAVAEELRAIGVEPNLDDLREKYRAAAEG